MTDFFKFDTIYKKPHIWSIAIISAAVAAVVAALLLIGPTTLIVPAYIIIDAYLITVIILLVRAFFKQLQYNPYSYNVIYYAGFAIFVLFVLITFVPLTVEIATAAEPYGENMIIFILMTSAREYMTITFPFILVFSVCLCISNIVLLRHEGRRLHNLLGIILSFFLVGAEVFLILMDRHEIESFKKFVAYEVFSNAFAGFYLYFECMLIGIIISKIVVSQYKPSADMDFMLVLGCAMKQDGTPTPLLKGRIDRAVEVRNAQLKESGKDLTFILSGGQGPDEPIAESECMKNYLLSLGIPEDIIVEENRSTTTMENMRFSKEIMQSIDPDGKIAFSTTQFHVFRSGLCARRAKMRAVGVGAKTKWYYWPNANVREFVALITEHRIKQAFILGGLLAFYIIITIVAFN